MKYDYHIQEKAKVVQKCTEHAIDTARVVSVTYNVSLADIKCKTDNTLAVGPYCCLSKNGCHDGGWTSCVIKGAAMSTNNYLQHLL